MRKQLSFANVTSCLALFMAMSAGAYAAVSLPANSVGTKQIKNGAVTKPKLAAKSVDGSKVAPRSLTGANINLTRLGKVPTATTADRLAKIQRTTAPGANKAIQDSVAAATATCPQGTFVVGGGAHLSDQANQVTNDSYPSANNAWTADVFNGGTGAPGFTVYALCARAAGAG
jgi:hypothetical protein